MGVANGFARVNTMLKMINQIFHISVLATVPLAYFSKIVCKVKQLTVVILVYVAGLLWGVGRRGKISPRKT